MIALRPIKRVACKGQPMAYGSYDDHTADLTAVAAGMRACGFDAAVVDLDKAGHFVYVYVARMPNGARAGLIGGCIDGPTAPWGFDYHDDLDGFDDLDPFVDGYTMVMPSAHVAAGRVVAWLAPLAHAATAIAVARGGVATRA